MRVVKNKERVCSEFWDNVFENPDDNLALNADGTISVYIENSDFIRVPILVSEQCCSLLNEYLDGEYTYDLDYQVCRWKPMDNVVVIGEPYFDCSTPENIEIVLNSDGDDGAMFYSDIDDKCVLTIDFDYLFKLKCDNLNEYITPNTLNKQTLAINEENTTDNIEINKQRVIISENSSKLEILREEFNKLNYSINCDDFPISLLEFNPGQVNVVDKILTSSQKKPFENSGFGGGLAPFSFPVLLYSQVNLCLTEPNGLNVWESILGESRFNSFLLGEPNSYNSSDVIEIYSRPTSIIEPLVFTCDTVFGAKSSIKKQIDELTIKEIEAKQIVDKLTNQVSERNEVINNVLPINQPVCNTPIGVMESLSIIMTINVVESNSLPISFNGLNYSLTPIYTSTVFPKINVGGLYNYLTAHPKDSGFFISGGNSSTPIIYDQLTFLGQPTFQNNTDEICLNIKNNIYDELFTQSALSSQTNGETVFNQSLGSTILASSWLNYTHTIEGEEIISLMRDKKIKLSLSVNGSCSDFCLLIDNISINKKCTQVDSEDILITKSPSFNLTRVVDNKKSWSTVNGEDREFDIKNVNNSEIIRSTDYKVLDDRQVINTKEIDLDINIGKAIENDVWTSILANPCILNTLPKTQVCNATGELEDECGDYINFNDLLSINVSEVKNINKLKEFFKSELIDVKNRKTIKSYATLKALYDRYMDKNLLEYNECDIQTAAFDYYNIEEFAKLLDKYWVELIEQVIPSTTMWGSVKIYGNTIFDQQKFTYKQSSLFSCINNQCNLDELKSLNECIGNIIDTFYTNECP